MVIRLRAFKSRNATRMDSVVERVAFGDMSEALLSLGTPCSEQITFCNKQTTFCSKQTTLCNEQITFCSEQITFCNEQITFCNKQIAFCNEQITFCNEQINSCSEQINPYSGLWIGCYIYTIRFFRAKETASLLEWTWSFS